MNIIDKKTISDNFTRSVEKYDEFADLQKEVAKRLMEMIFEAQNGLIRPLRKILEIGCGTGFLSGMLLSKFPVSDISFIDISEGMLDACRERLRNIKEFNNQRKLCFLNMDGESFGAFSDYDLIVSNLTFQWFHDLKGALLKYRKYLKKDGKLIFSTFGHGALNELRGCMINNRIAPLEYITEHEFDSISDCYSKCNFYKEDRIKYYSDPLTFLRTLHNIGARTTGYDDLTGITKMRRLIESIERLRVNGMGIPATYEIIYGICIK